MSDPTEVEALARALVEANDLLLGVYDMTDLATTSLDETASVRAILERARRLTAAEAIVLMTPTRRIGVGAAGAQHAIDHGDDIAHIASVEQERSSDVGGELRALRTELPFSTGDRKLLRAVLSSLLSAIETARLHRQQLDHALGEQDLRRASEVAQLALPSTRPRADGLDVFVHAEQARQTGGDLFCFDVDDDRFRFAVGDVSGKGLSAAVVMTTAICAAKAAFRDPVTDTPGRQIARINDWMLDHLTDTGMFITLFVGEYRMATGELTWSNAGHSPCLVRSGQRIESLDAHTPPVGILSDLAPPTDRVQLLDDDVVVIGTDGIVDQASSLGEPFGEDRFRAVIGANTGKRAASLGTSLVACVSAFAAGGVQTDDRTMVVLRHQGGRR